MLVGTRLEPVAVVISAVGDGGDWGPGQEVGDGGEGAQGCVNEKQRGIADPVSGPEQAGSRNGLSATQREL